VSGTLAANPAITGTLGAIREYSATIAVSPTLALNGELRLLDSVNQTVYSTTVSAPAYGADDSSGFVAYGPASGVQQVQLWSHGVLVDSVQRTGNAPQITVTSPVAGQVITDVISVVWTASDQDGDDVTVDVEYVGDTSEDWVFLGTLRDGGTATVDPYHAPPSTKATLLVHASDGMNTTTIEINDLDASYDREPQVSMVAPANGQSIHEDGNVQLIANTIDPEGTDLLGVAWYSDVDGYLASGSIANVLLSSGAHTITVVATDSSLQTAMAAVSVAVIPH
jgi:hypothetical protein